MKKNFCCFFKSKKEVKPKRDNITSSPTFYNITRNPENNTVKYHFTPSPASYKKT